MKQLAWFTTVIMATLTGVLLVWQFREAVLLFLFSLAVAAAFRPPITGLNRRGVPLGLALTSVYVIAFSVIGVLLVNIGPQLLTDLQHMANDFATGYQHILAVWPQGSPFQQSVAEHLPPLNQLYQALFGQQGTDILQTLFGATLSFFEAASYLGLILVLSVYWTTDRVHFERLWLSLLSVEYRSRARTIWREIELNVGDYIRSEVVQSLLGGVLLGLGYYLIGLNYPVLLALIGTLAWFVPVLGALLALIPIIWVGLSGGIYLTIAAVCYTIVVFLILEGLVEPRFFNQRRFSGLLQVLIMIAFVDGLGLIGLLIAPPVAIAAQILFSQLLQQQIPLMAGKTVPELTDLRRRVVKMRAMLKKSEAEPSPQVSSMLGRLDQLLQEADDTPVPEYPGGSPQTITPISAQIVQQPLQ